MKDCDRCLSGEICSVCKGDKIPAFDRKSCVDPLPNCIDNPSDYWVRNQKFVCTNCADGYIVDEDGKCVKCSTIQNCIECE